MTVLKSNVDGAASVTRVRGPASAGASRRQAVGGCQPAAPRRWAANSRISCRPPARLRPWAICPVARGIGRPRKGSGPRKSSANPACSVLRARAARAAPVNRQQTNRDGPGAATCQSPASSRWPRQPRRHFRRLAAIETFPMLLEGSSHAARHGVGPTPRLLEVCVGPGQDLVERQGRSSPAAGFDSPASFSATRGSWHNRPLYVECHLFSSRTNFRISVVFPADIEPRNDAYESMASGFCRFSSGKATGPPCRCDSKTATIISVAPRAS
jgi:hypothetical protein